MCGILGYYNIGHSVIDREKEEIIALRDQMIHRGPDSGGYLEAAQRNWILAHRRLSILDLSKNGSQPMSDIDNKIHISYNGEIYNFKDLRCSLIKKGFNFRSNTDTEVILYLYKEYGTDCLNMLDGMFAFIIIDENNHHAIIARDPAGKKPIYYYLINNTLIVASSLGVIANDKDYKRI